MNPNLSILYHSFSSFFFSCLYSVPLCLETATELQTVHQKVSEKINRINEKKNPVSHILPVWTV